jgi:hypothetical protein
MINTSMSAASKLAVHHHPLVLDETGALHRCEVVASSHEVGSVVLVSVVTGPQLKLEIAETPGA